MTTAKVSSTFTSGSFASAIGLERACFFSVGQKLLAVEGSFVREVVTVSSLTPLPRTSPELLGLFAVRDEVWPLISLARLFGLPDEPRELAVLIAQGERRAALALGEVLGFAPFDRRALEPVSVQATADADTGTKAEQTFGAGVLREGERRALLLGIPTLLEDLRRRLSVL